MRPLFCLISVFLTLNLFGQLPSNMYADSANAPFLWGVSGIFNVEAKDYYSYVVFDMANGRTISEFGSRKTLFDKKKFNIDLSNHPNGSYLVKYFNAKGELKGYQQLIRQ